MKNTYDGKYLCCLAISDECAGLMDPEDHYEDAQGNKWDMCKKCVEQEQRVLLQSMVE